MLASRAAYWSCEEDSGRRAQSLVCSVLSSSIASSRAQTARSEWPRSTSGRRRRLSTSVSKTPLISIPCWRMAVLREVGDRRIEGVILGSLCGLAVAVGAGADGDLGKVLAKARAALEAL